MRVDEQSLVASRSGLLRDASRIVGYTDAEDVVQDAFERAWRAKSVKANSDLRPWLRRIARNVAFDMLRKRARSLKLYGVQRDIESAETTALHHESIAMVGVVLGALPRVQRRAFVLHDIAGYSSHEIAQLDGVAYETVRSRLFRARRRLRQGLDDTISGN